MAGFDYAAFERALIADLREHGGKTTSGPMAGKPLGVLTTTGAKTGESRTAIVTLSRDGDRYVIAASKSGAPTHPSWYHNLVKQPTVTLEAGGETFKARATVTDGAERDRLWTRHVAEFPEFGEYPKKTDRVIPVIVLDRLR
jgi:deazaflavin-dependent oxidoreductase (nitroreductase family)